MATATKTHKENPIKKWKDLRKKVKRVLDTTELHHEEAYISAVKKHLMTDDGIDYGRLNDDEVQKEFADTMADHYLEQAKKYFNIQKNLKEYEKDILTTAYANTTREELRRLVNEHGSEFKFKKYSEETTKFIKKLGNTLLGAIRDQFKEKHLEDILDYVELKDMINPEKLTLPEALEFLELYEESEGAISKRKIARQLKRTKAYLLTDEGKEYAKHANEN